MSHEAYSFHPTKTIKDIPTMQYIKSRIVGPVAMIKAIINPIAGNRHPGNILFTARYISGKAIEGYDFL